MAHAPAVPSICCMDFAGRTGSARDQPNGSSTAASFCSRDRHDSYLDSNCLSGGTLAVEIRASGRQRTGRASRHQDRFLTALDLPRIEESLLSDAARRETSRFAARLRVGDYLRPRLPWRNALWLLLPLAALGIIEGLKEWRAGQLAPELASARQLLEQAGNRGASGRSR